MSHEIHHNGIKIYGESASPGISIGIARVLKKNKMIPSGITLNNDQDIKTEVTKFERSILKSVADIHRIKKNEGSTLSQDAVEILETHIEFLTDLQLKTDVCRQITHNRKNAIDAVIEVIQHTVQVFNNLDNVYLRSRAADVKDIGNRILNNLGAVDKIERQFQPNTIIIAEDISPTDTLQMDLGQVVGLVTRNGGKTSHTAILAKSKNIPAVLGCGDALFQIEDDDVLLVDATAGLILVNPNEDCIEEYKKLKSTFDQQQKFLRSLKDTPARTMDGVKVELMVNISDAVDLEESKDYGAEGVGLFRTEGVYMNRSSFPSEEEQFELYKKVALNAKGKPVMIRTVDIGADKPLDYFTYPKEENPFLGYRGIRFSLDRKDIFSVQLRAILRATVFGNLKLMFPMISNIEELRLAKQVLNDAMNELQQDQIEFDRTIQVGIMIEVPSAAIMSDILSKEVDFFSIGTNDLCQYTLAVDRGNEKIKALYNPFDPAVLRLISRVIEQANQSGIGVSLCGELASDPLATVMLLGMGLNTFSMNASSIPIIKSIIIQTDSSHARQIWSKVLSIDNLTSIIAYLQKQQ